MVLNLFIPFLKCENIFGGDLGDVAILIKIETHNLGYSFGESESSWDQTRDDGTNIFIIFFYFFEAFTYYVEIRVFRPDTFDYFHEQRVGVI